MEKVLNKEECIEIIKKYLKSDDAVVHRFQILPLSDEYPGFCAEYCRLKIMFNDLQGFQKIENFFVKLLPLYNVQKRDLIVTSGIFIKEVRLYSTLAPQLQKYSGDYKWCPDCYFTRDDIIVMEDLCCKSYDTVPLKIDYTSDHMYKSLKSLAVFHMSSLVYEIRELKPLGTNIGEKYKNMLFETTFLPGNEWCICGFNTLKAVALNKTKYGYGTKYEELIETHLIEKLERVYEINKNPVSKIPKTWIHRDIWKNNLMFKFEKDEKNHYLNPQHCVILDFAISRYLPLSLDVIITIILTTRRPHREAKFNDYLKFYYEQLKEELSNHDVDINDLFSFQEFFSSCHSFVLLPLVMNSLFITLTCLPADFLIDMSENKGAEYHKMIVENRDPVVLNNMEKDEWYCGLLTEAVEELVEYLFVNENIF